MAPPTVRARRMSGVKGAALPLELLQPARMEGGGRGGRRRRRDGGEDAAAGAAGQVEQGGEGREVHLPLPPPPHPAHGGLRRTASRDGVIDMVHSNIQYRFVIKGYRIHHSWVDSVISIFTLHNQTVNIWTHLAGALYFVYAGRQIFAEMDALNSPRWEYVAFSIYLACALLQMASSAAYHTFQCLSAEAEDVFLRIDIAGIAAMVFGSFVVGLHNGFECQPQYHYLYLGIISLMLAVAVVGGFMRSWEHGETVRNVGFGVAVSFGIVPMTHWFMIAHPHAASTMMWACIGMFGCYGLGFFFFVTRIPERFAPGMFDLVGHSHQLWHVFVWAAGVAWCEGMWAYFHDRNAHPMPCGALVA